MVGIVVVSHSPDLARAAVRLALQMAPGPAPVSRSQQEPPTIALAPMQLEWQRPSSLQTAATAWW
jgi:hypothetical protein